MSKSRFNWVCGRWGFLMAAICLMAACAAEAQTTGTNRPASRRNPSIILIMADGVGCGDLGCYGQTRIKTPNIDKLAAGGMRFTSFYAGSPVALPSRAVLMTGKHTGHASIRGAEGAIVLPPAEKTLSEILRDAGFRSAALGVWGLGDVTGSVPGSRGFEEWLGYLNDADGQNHYPEFLNRTGEGYERQIELKGRRFADDLFTETALNFMKFAKPDSFNNFRPFFLYLPYTTARANLAVARATGNGMEVPNDAPYSDEQWTPADKNRAAMITRLDGDVGQLMAKLAEYKIDRNTIVIFTSINGPRKEGGVDPAFFNSMGGLRGYNHDLAEGGIRVPLIVSWPVRMKPGAVSDLPCASWDLLPTAAEITHETPPKDIDGISLLPTLLGSAQTNRHEFLYWELHEHGFAQAARMGDWKAVRASANGPLELYNLKNDAGEKNNVADKNPEVVTKMENYLKIARTDDKNWPIQTAAETAQNKEH